VIKCQLISAEFQKASRDYQATKVPSCWACHCQQQKLKLCRHSSKVKPGVYWTRPQVRAKLQRAMASGNMTLCLSSNDLPFLPRLPFHLFLSVPLGLYHWAKSRRPEANLLHWGHSTACSFVHYPRVFRSISPFLLYILLMQMQTCKAAVALAPSNMLVLPTS
jgi:hypothetical protein